MSVCSGCKALPWGKKAFVTQNRFKNAIVENIGGTELRMARWRRPTMVNFHQ